MKAKRDSLNEIVQNLTVKLYEQAAQQQAQEILKLLKVALMMLLMLILKK